MSYGKKDVRIFVKFLKSKVEPILNVENLRTTKHIQLQITAENQDGDVITLPAVCIPSTPSDQNWRRLKIADINRIFRTHNIQEIRQ